ncbi:MAG: hypothetical protein CML13_10755 [Puniceicoccaceae bacterium]|nr:hypothetical protein [Puniceicoccaceae bacterium]|tara:strand:- start:42260 stop:43573 length:1314 start_codon:yes stop_codon:yes gene_type:complete
MSFFFICIYLFFLIIRPQDWALPILEVFRPVLLTQALAIGFCALEVMGKTLKMPDKRNPWWILMGGLFFSVAMSHLANTYLSGLVSSVTDFGKIFITFVVLWINLNTVKRLELFTLFLVLMCCFISVNCILQIQTGTGFGGSEPLIRPIPGSDEFVYQAHYFGIFSDPNDTAQLLTLALPLTVFVLIRYSNFLLRIAAMIVLITIVWAIFTTESRGGFLSLVVTAGVAFRKMMSVKQFAFCCFCGVFLITIFLPSRFSGGLMDDSMRERVNFWGEANYAFIQKPLFGVGYGMITDYIPKNRSVHNSFVHAYAELGTFGYIFWFSCLAFAFISLWQMAELKTESTEDRHLSLWLKCLVPGLAGMYLSGYFLSRTYQLPFFVIFAMCAACYTLVARQTGVRALNDYCWIGERKWWIWPCLSVTSMVFIYLSIRVMNSMG